MQKPSIDFFNYSFVVIFILTCFLSLDAYSQDRISDLQLISSTQSHESHELKTKKKVTFTQAVNPVYWVYKGGLAVYQKHISPQLSTHCIYETSCSRFSRKLIDSHGLVKGIFLTCDRLSKCNRITFAETSRLRLSKNGRIRESTEDYTFKK